MATSPIAAPYASASLYVGDLVPEVTEALLFEIFSAVGAVASVRVCRDAATRRSLGYSYVNFHRNDDAERSLDTMNFTNIRGRPCRIMWSHRDPSLRKSGVGNIFVKNLAKSIDNKSLYDTFSVFGNILSCKVATNSKRESLGYGFVHYENGESAEQAIANVNGMAIAGEKVIVAAFKSKKERGGGDKTKFTNVYVKNLPEEFKREDLEEMFGKYGDVTSCFLAADEKESKGKAGFGFVNYKTADQAAAAVTALDGKELPNAKKPLVVCRAQKRDEREKELREKFEQSKLERQKKYAGVNLYVKNLSDTVDDERLTQEFSKFGNITSARVMKDSATKGGPLKSKGFGFVCFATPEEATKAVTEMNGHMFENKPLYVALAQRKDFRKQQLEAHHAQRAKMGVMVPQPQMYPPQGTPMYYQGVPAMQNQFYPQVMRRPAPWVPQQPPMMGVRPQGSYQLMPMNGQQQQQQRQLNPNQGGGGGRGRGGRGRGGRPTDPKNSPSQQQQQPSYKYNTNARNQGVNQQQQAVAGGPSVGQQPVDAGNEDADLSIKALTSALASAPEENRKQMLGERLFPLISIRKPDLAGKITGMLLEMDNGELLSLLESDVALNDKINEAMNVLAQSQEAEEGNDGDADAEKSSA